jgi:hypothetical protein
LWGKWRFADFREKKVAKVLNRASSRHDQILVHRQQGSGGMKEGAIAFARGIDAGQLLTARCFRRGEGNRHG